LAQVNLQPSFRCPEGQLGTAGTQKGPRFLLRAVLGAPGLRLPRTKTGMRECNPCMAACMAFPSIVSPSSRKVEEQTCPPLPAEHPTCPVRRQPCTAPSSSWPRKQGAQASRGFYKLVTAIPLHPLPCYSSCRIWVSLPWGPLTTSSATTDSCAQWQGGMFALARGFGSVFMYIRQNWFSFTFFRHR